MLKTYLSSIESGAFEDDSATHKSQYKEFEQTVKQLEKRLDSNRQDCGTEANLFKNKTASSQNVEMKNMNNRQMVIEEGHRAQK